MSSALHAALQGGLFVGAALAAAAALRRRASWPADASLDLNSNRAAGPENRSHGAISAEAHSLASETKEISRLKALIAAERAGRAAAERAFRDVVNKSIYDEATGSGYPVFPIGTIRGPYRQRRGAGRQGLLVPDSRAELVLSPSVPPESLENLTDWGHIYLVFIFHENSISIPALPKGEKGQPPPHQQGSDALSSSGDASAATTAVAMAGKKAGGGNPWASLGRSFAARVAAPGLYGGKTGVFATRSPHRPNAIGLSLVKLVSVDMKRRTLLVSGCDLIEGTPVVDIKPAAPYDCPTCLGGVLGHERSESAEASPSAPAAAPVAATEASPFSSSSEAAASSLIPVPLHMPAKHWQLKVPTWVAANLVNTKRLPVAFAPSALASLRQLCLDGQLQFYRGGEPAEADAAVRAVVQALSLDIRAVHRGRGTAGVNAHDDEAGGGGEGEVEASDIPTINGFQRYELFFDATYIVFTIRPGTAERPADSADAALGADAAAAGSTVTWCCVEAVSFSPLPSVGAGGGKGSASSSKRK